MDGYYKDDGTSERFIIRQDHDRKRRYGAYVKLYRFLGALDCIDPSLLSQRVWRPGQIHVSAAAASVRMTTTSRWGSPRHVGRETSPSLRLNETPPGPGRLLETDNYQGIIDHVYNGPKHGKIIQWSGVNDQNVWYVSQLRFYRAVATLFGGGKTGAVALANESTANWPERP